MNRTNEGFEIISAVRMPGSADEEIVIGHRNTEISSYVCWRCRGGDNYFWGHYFDSYNAALTDMIGRLTIGKQWNMEIHYSLWNNEKQDVDKLVEKCVLNADSAVDLVDEVNIWWRNFKKEKEYKDDDCWISYVKEV